MTTSMKLKVAAVTLGLAGLATALAPAMSFAHGDGSSGTPHVDVAISESGKVLVRGAKITSVSSSTVNASTNWGGIALNWSVSTDSATAYYDARGKEGSFGSIVTGDTVSFAGMLTSIGSTFGVSATAMKDWTPVPSEAKIRGAVSSVNATSTTVVLSKNKNKNVTVQFTGSTLITLSGTSTPFSSIAVDDHLKVTGSFNADETILTATSVVLTKQVSVTDKRWNAVIKGWFSDKRFGLFGKFGD